jgi:glycosyl hydrolase family 53
MSFENRERPIETSDAEHESGQSPDIEFLVTDHSVRYPEQFSQEELKELYGDMKRHGISSVRFDMDWDEIAKSAGERDKATLDHYVGVLQVMEEVGMKPPTLVLSSPPEWAQELYKKDKEAYFRAYEEYISSVADVLSRSGVKVHSAQLFNEVNNSLLFKFVSVEDLPRCATIVREKIGREQPEMRLATSLIVGNVNENLGKVAKTEAIDKFLDNYGPMLKENFDVVSIDYYPGVWHFPAGEKRSEISNPLGEPSLETKTARRLSSVEGAANPKHINAMFKNLELLKNTFEHIAKLGIDYEIGETGFPTNIPYSTENRQRYFYDSFFRSFRQLLVDFKSRGIPLPKRVDLYETQDEENKGFGGIMDKVLKVPGVQKLTRVTPNPEHNFGLRTKSGEPKSVLRGSRHGKKGISDEAELSQLQKIIKYVNRPISSS